MPEKSAGGRTVILTGAAGVLGQAMALALLRVGHRVLLCDLHQEPLQGIVDASGVADDRVAICAADLTTPWGLRATEEVALRKFGGADVLVNNAALTAFAAWPDDASRPPPWQMTTDLVRRFFEINMIAQHSLTSLFLPGMISRGWGRIINITCSYDTMQRIFPYGATKAALEAFTGTLELQLAGTGVTANTLNPGGPVATPTHVEKNPGRKWVAPEVMNAPLLFLASEASNGIGGRRYVGSAWDTSLDPSAALNRASGPLAWRGFGDEALK